MKEKIGSYCGLNCKTCYFQIPIVTCQFIIPEEISSVCKIAICESKQFCGECNHFPCKILTVDRSNPVTDKADLCKSIKDILVKEARKGLNNSVGHCGHHCDFCFLGEWCGGCRSNFNCCSFATLSPDGVCPNTKCVEKKGLSGCYDCDELVDCKKGYYGRENEYVAKATALFIKEFGEQCYTATLRRAIESGEDYPKSFDFSGSVENALNILKRYL